jgi:hypothetical protein
MEIEEMVPSMIANELDVLLHRGAIKRELIITNENTRGIGKTTALVNFAKKYNLGVIVPSEHNAKRLRKEFNYEHIYSYLDLISNNGLSQYVIDEGVEPEFVKFYYGVDIVTGFKYVGGIK